MANVETLCMVGDTTNISNTNSYSFKSKLKDLIPDTLKIIEFCNKYMLNRMVPVLTIPSGNIGKIINFKKGTFERYINYSWNIYDNKVSDPFDNFVYRSNMAVIVSNDMIVIDVDNALKDDGNNGVEYMNKLCKSRGYENIVDFCKKEGVNYTETPSGGYHLYFMYEYLFGEKIGKTFICCKSIDVKKEGEFVIAPYSVYQGCVEKYLYDEHTKTYSILNPKPHKCGGSHDVCGYKGKKYIPHFKDLPNYRELTDEELKGIPPLYIKCPEWIKNEFIHVDKPSNEKIVYKPIDTIAEKNTILQYIECCKSMFLNSRDEWRIITWTIKAILGEDGREIVHKYSQDYTSYTYNETDKLFNDGKEGYYTIGTLKHYAKMCNKEKYETINKKFYIKNITMFLFKGDGDILAMLLPQIKDDIITHDTEKVNGYIWDNKTKLYKVATRSYYTDLILSTIMPYVDEPLAYVNAECNRLDSLLTGTDDDDENTKRLLKQLLKYKKELETNQIKLQSITLAERLAKLVAKRTHIDKFEENVLNRQQPEMIPIPDGKMLNLKTGEIRDRVRTDYFTYQTSVSPKLDENGNFWYDSQRWDSYMDELCCDDKELATYLITLLGYSLTKDTKDRQFYIWYGHGSNGKSTLMNLLTILVPLGDGCWSSTSDTFLKRKKNTDTDDNLLKMKNALFTYYTETDTGDILDGAKIKKYTGNDIFSCRGIFKQPVTFSLMSKLHLITNKLPLFDAEDNALCVRMSVIPFNKTYLLTPESKRKSEALFNDFVKHLDEFFSMLVIGAMRYYREGLIVPQAVIKATNQYINRYSIVSNYMSEELEECTTYSHCCGKLELIQSFKSWCENQDIRLQDSSRNGIIELLENKITWITVTKGVIAVHKLNNKIGYKFKEKEE